MEQLTVETDVATAAEEMNDEQDSIGDTEGDLGEEHRTIVEQLNEIMMEGKTGDGIMFKKVGKKVLKLQIGRVN